MDEQHKEKIVKLLRDRGGTMAWYDLVCAIAESTGSLAIAHDLIVQLDKDGIVDIDRTSVRLRKPEA